ncbi:5-oxoprolinase subunit PxpB [Planococcus sp. MERTA32b]|nr:5-oxoprolinase subunit PxpB [Planococcus sp. MER TA 32b]
MDYSFSPLGDQAIIIEVGTSINEETHNRIRAITSLLGASPPQWMTECIPAFTTISVAYSPLLATFEEAKNELASLLKKTEDIDVPHPRTIEIPVCYGGGHGPDLEFVARHNGLSPEEVIAIHTGTSYTVHMIGFAPGFPYLGGMSEKIAAPRRESPRGAIPERSVGIAGNQTGVYPISTPGGWQLIGRTPTRLFLPDREIPSLLQAGDTIVFRQITPEEYQTLEEKENADHI